MVRRCARRREGAGSPPVVSVAPAVAAALEAASPAAEAAPAAAAVAASPIAVCIARYSVAQDRLAHALLAGTPAFDWSQRRVIPMTCHGLKSTPEGASILQAERFNKTLDPQ